jgi:hypothetical protein
MIADLIHHQLRLNVGCFDLLSNRESLISLAPYFSRDTKFSLATRLQFEWISVPDTSRSPLGRIVLIDLLTPDARIETASTALLATGPLEQMELAVRSREHTLFGNQGPAFRFILACLERHASVHTLHAAALYDEKRERLLVAVGKSGSGKSGILVDGLRRGLRLFSAELLQFAVRGQDVHFFAGSSLDNLWPNSFLPGLERVSVEDTSEEQAPVTASAHSKVPVDLDALRATIDQVCNPRVTLVFPRLDHREVGVRVSPVDDLTEVRRLLFMSASECLSSPMILYGNIIVPALDEPALARRRWASISALPMGKGAVIDRALSLVGGSGDCLDWWYDEE